MLKAGEQRSIFNFYKSAQPSDGIPVNPKGYFANERTFLHWINLTVIIGGVGIGLLNFGDSMAQISGLVFSFFSIIIMFYSLYKYLQRSDLLEKKQKGNDYMDEKGSIALIFIVLSAVAINFIVKFSVEIINKLKFWG
jgi:uncharacterized membrane protein YidH (DUF202 family)